MPAAPAIIMGAATVGSAVLSSSASSKAAKTQASAAQSAADAQLQMSNQSREDMTPWRLAGQKALGTLEQKINAGPGEFTASPGYQYTLGQGEKAINRYMASRGKYTSPAAGLSLMRNAEGLASTEYDKFLNRYYQSLTPYQSLAGVGMTSASNTAQLGQNAAAGAGNAYLNQGSARASGYINQSNAITGGIQGLSNIYAMYKTGYFGNNNSGNSQQWANDYMNMYNNYGN